MIAVANSCGKYRDQASYDSIKTHLMQNAIVSENIMTYINTLIVEMKSLVKNKLFKLKI